MKNKSVKKTKPIEFEYDVAISYAGEDKRRAGRLARELEAGGARVFIDRKRKASLWGKDKSEFERVYSTATRFVIPLISENYVGKEFCQFEFEVAKQEEKKRSGEFILPVRLDDARQEGLTADTYYLDYREETSGSIARTFAEKLRLGDDRVRTGTDVSDDTSGPELVVLDSERRYHLGLLALSFFPLPIGNMNTLFREINWAREFRYFRRKGLLTKSAGGWQMPERIRKAFLQNKDESSKINADWITALAPHANHPDTALALSSHLLMSDSPEGAVIILTDIALALDSGIWNAIYVNVLESLESNLLPKSLCSESWVRLRNALGVCMARAGRNDEAIRLFDRVRRQALRIGDEWAVVQALINSGVAHYQSGDMTAAAKTYRKCIKRAEMNGDVFNQARSMNNLAQLIIDDDPECARQLMEQSLSLKKEIGDRQGIVGSYLALGNLLVHLRDLKSALRWFDRAEKKAKKLDLRFERSSALINIGSVESDLGHHKRACTLYAEAQTIATEEEFAYPLALALRNQAMLRAQLGQNRAAQELFEKLADAHKHAQNDEGYVSAVHDQGALLINRGEIEDGREQVKRAQRLAKKRELRGLVFQTHRTYGLSYLTEGNPKKCCGTLAKSAKTLQRSDVLSAVHLLMLAAEVEQEFSDGAKNNHTYYYQSLEILSHTRGDGFQEYRLSAICSGAVGDVAGAERHWKLCKTRAVRNRDRQASFEASLQLARLSLEKHEVGGVISCLDEADQFATTPIEDIAVLTLRLEVLLTQDNRKDAGKVFAKARRICRKHDFTLEYLDLHMRVGDYDWGRGKRLQYAALKAYTAALAESITLNENEDVMIQVGNHIVCTLCLAQFTDGTERISYLKQRINNWLSRELSVSNKKSQIEWLLWPFRVVAALSEVSTPDLLTEEHFASVMDSEMQLWAKLKW